MKYRILSKKNCIFCLRAKALLMAKNLDFDYEDHSEPEKLEAIKEQGFKTMPVIYFGDKLIGGYTDLEKYLEQA